MTREPTDDRKKHVSPTAVAIVFIVLALIAYVAVYFLGSHSSFGGYTLSFPGGSRIRYFQTPSVAKLYIPVAFIECRILRQRVVLRSGHPAEKTYYDRALNP